MAARGITHIRLGLDGRIAFARWQEVAAARMPTGPAREATIVEIASAIESGDQVTFWTQLQGGQRACGGGLRVEREADGRPALIEAGAGARRLMDLPRF